MNFVIVNGNDKYLTACMPFLNIPDKFKFKLCYCTIMFYTAKRVWPIIWHSPVSDHSLSSDQIYTNKPCLKGKQIQLKIKHTFIWISVYRYDMIWSVPLQPVKLFILLQKVFLPFKIYSYHILCKISRSTVFVTQLLPTLTSLFF